ncbi:hypothetical protein [Mucilaginibacter sp.]|uniref:hypothetical protein n=1 Tax=Mucilaginibacter sp. TaxID=1882438 RepID=UPI002ED6BC6B
MKKLILAAIVSLFAAGANAQTAQPMELNSTGQAITFNVSLTSMWRITMPRIGQVETEKIAASYTTLPFYKFANQQATAQQSQFSKDPLLTIGKRFDTNALTLNGPLSPSPENDHLSGKLKTIFPSASILEPSVRHNFTMAYAQANYAYRSENLVAGI